MEAETTWRSAPVLRWGIVVLTLLALASAGHHLRPTWERLGADRREYAAFTDEARDGAPSSRAGFSPLMFEFLRSQVRDDDRFYLHAPRDPYGTLDLHDTVAALARYYLLPAVEVTDPADATVVVAYRADPAELGLEYLTDVRRDEVAILRPAP